MVIAQTPGTNGELDLEEESLLEGDGDGEDALVPASEVEDAAEKIWQFIIDQGQATKPEIRKALQAIGVDTALYQKGFAKLAQGKAVTEVAREDGKKAFELKKHWQRFSYREFVLALADFSGAPKPRGQAERFSHWYELHGSLVLTSPMLSSRPVPGHPSRRAFERGAPPENRQDWTLWIPRGNFSKMLVEASYKPLAPDIGPAKWPDRGIQFYEQFLPAKLIVTILNPVPPSAPGRSGQGLTEIEAIRAGCHVPWRAVVPGSHCTPVQFMQLMKIAGDWCGLSPSAHKLGWGCFRPEVSKEAFAKAMDTMQQVVAAASPTD